MEYSKLILIFVLNIIVAESVIVEVEEGLLLGEEKTFITGNGTYYSFMSVPYAEPPVGPLRFRDPRPAKPWEGIRNATSEPPSCPQPRKFNVEYSSEDCLFLNVYTPVINPEQLLPVIFFIHGGTFIFGSGNFSSYGPDFLVDKGVILVTLNFRLGPLGFLCLDIPEVPGNAGLKDLVQGLRWVQANIKVFGGDPDNITLFGNSGGAWATGLFMLSPVSNYLFRRAIFSSGNPFLDLQYNIAPAIRAKKLATMFGSNSTDRYDMFELLQTVPVDDLVNANPMVLALETIDSSRISFPPVIEEDFGQERIITDSIYNLFDNFIVQKEIVIGHTDAESLIVANDYERYKDIFNNFRGLLVPFQIITSRAPNDILDITEIIFNNYFGDVLQITNDTIFEFSTLISDLRINNNWQRFVRRLPKYVKVYAYLFSCVSERNKYLESAQEYGLQGAGHTDDLDYIFNPHYRNLSLNTNSISYKMIQQTTTLLTNFAKYGNPTPDASLGVTWQPYDEQLGAYLTIDENLSSNTNFDENLRDFWKYLYEFAGFEY